MAMLFLFSLLALAACISASCAQGGPNKTAIDPAFDVFGTISKRIKAQLPHRNYTVTHWEKGWLPHDCAYHAETLGYAPADLEAFNLTYPDCDEPWVACRHKDAKTNISTIGHVRQIVLYFIPLLHRRYKQQAVDRFLDAGDYSHRNARFQQAPDLDSVFPQFGLCLNFGLQHDGPRRLLDLQRFNPRAVALLGLKRAQT
jgi:hypothetical protein